MNNFYKIISLLFCTFLIFSPLHAVTYTVDESQLEMVLKQLKNGDQLILKAGVYTKTKMVLDNDYIHVKSEHPGTVVFSGDSSISIRSDHVTIEGIFFDSISSPPVVHFSGARNGVLKNSIFRNCGDGSKSWRHVIRLSNGAKGNVVRNILMDGNQSMGIGIIIKDNTPLTMENSFVSNIFRNTVATESKGGKEVIQIGQGGHSYAAATYTAVDSSVFLNVDGDSEAISVKSSHNQISKNMFVNSLGGIVIRGGSRNDVVGNCMKGGNVGLRLHGTNHDIQKNLFIENKIGMVVPAGSSGHAQNGLHEVSVSSDITDNAFVANRSALLFDSWYGKIHRSGGTWDVLTRYNSIASNFVAIRWNEVSTKGLSSENFWSGNKLYHLEGGSKEALDSRKFRLLRGATNYIDQLSSRYPSIATQIASGADYSDYCTLLLNSPEYASLGPNWSYQE